MPGTAQQIDFYLRLAVNASTKARTAGRRLAESRRDRAVHGSHLVAIRRIVTADELERRYEHLADVACEWLEQHDPLMAWLEPPAGPYSD